MILPFLTRSWMKKYRRATCLTRELQVRFPATCRAEVLSIFVVRCRDACRIPVPSSCFRITLLPSSLALRPRVLPPWWIALSSLQPHLEAITGAFARKIIYEGIDLPLSGLLPQFAPENAVNLKPPCLYLMANPPFRPGSEVDVWLPPCELWTVYTSPLPVD